MILVTGGAGFIGSGVVAQLNARGIEDILIVDILGKDQRWKNLRNLRYADEGAACLKAPRPCARARACSPNTVM